MKAGKDQNTAYFAFRARNRETWIRFERVWQAMSVKAQVLPFTGEAVALDSEALCFRWDLNGVPCASRAIFELFAALHPLQREADRSDTVVDFTAEWAVNDAKGHGHGRLGRRIPKFSGGFALLTSVRYNVEKLAERREKTCASGESSQQIWTARC